MTQRQFEALLEAARPRMERLVALRIDLHLRARFLPSDVVQSILVEAVHRRSEFLADGRPIIVWLRGLALRQLDVLRRVNLPSCAAPSASVLPVSDFWQRLLPGGSPKIASDQRLDYRDPSLKQRIRFAVESLIPSDMELLTMVHGECLAVAEMAAILRTTPSVVRSRYRRALVRFQEMFQLTCGPFRTTSPVPSAAHCQDAPSHREARSPARGALAGRRTSH